MKAFNPFLLSLLAAASLTAAPLEKIVTLTGRTYRQCEIVKVHPDGVSFTHANGAAKVAFTDLSPEWRTRLGYDPAKAEAYRLEQKRLREAQEEVRRKHEQERGEALLLAQQIELARLRGLEEQARAERAAAAQTAFDQPSAVPEVTSLGAVFDSRDYRGVGYRDRDRFYGTGYGYPWGGYYYGGGGGWWGNPCPPPYCPPHVHGRVSGRIGGVTFSIGR